MAESIVSFALEKLSTFLIAEAEFLGSLSGDVRTLEKELATIKEVLKDAERKAEEDDSINEWLRQVREIGYNIEDVLDEYCLLKQQRPHQLQYSLPDSSQNHEFYLMIKKLRIWLHKVVACFSNVKQKHELTSTIKEIKVELVEISSRRERYKFITTTDNSNERSQNHLDTRISSLFMDDYEVFGFEEHKAEIIKWLNLEKNNDVVEFSRSVIAVVGMGGIGKTTLVRKVYDNNDVRKCFHFYAWVTVSQSYDWKDLLRSIFKQVHAEPSLQVDTGDEVTIIDNLRNHLKDERYIVIFDDVWDVELLSFVKATLPSNNKSSRILMTTRDRNIALQWMASLGGHLVYDLKPLPHEVAWDLFCYKIFGNRTCPSELESLSSEMVEKCDGLPLAIVAIAGLLSTKAHSEWNQVLNSLSFELGRNEYFSSTTKILLLSYHDLPYYLKPCFLYFGLLPEAHFLQCIKLIRLWIAEGFIQNQRGKTLEEVAEGYLNQLVHRNLVQVCTPDDIYTKRVKLCWVHGILREMIILPKLENLNFCHILSEDNVLPTCKSFRRLSIHDDSILANNSFSISEMLTSNPGVRSVLWFAHSHKLPNLSVSSLLKVARFLKVLDLEDAPIDHIPEELRNFNHLQYLSVKNTKIKVIPKSIGELRNLQTLNLKRCSIVELPREISKCHKLRHLLTFWVNDKLKMGVKIHDRVLENLKELQKLAYIEADRASLIEALQQLKQLRRLAITTLKKEQGKTLCHTIEEMKHLRSLSITSIDRDEILDLQYIVKSPPLLLESLYLIGRLEKLPNWVTKLNNLSSLNLISSRLENDPMKSLGVLSNLVRLTLKNAYVGEILDFGFNQFSKLEFLVLIDLEKLKSLVGVNLPALRDAFVTGCPFLHDLPPQISVLLICKRNQVKLRVAVMVSKAALQFIQGCTE